jgi:nitrate reductase NapE component
MEQQQTLSTDKKGEGQLPSIFELFKKTFDVYKEKFKIILYLAALPVAVSVLSFVAGAIGGLGLVSFVLSVVSLVVMFLFYPALVLVIFSETLSASYESAKEFYRRACKIFWPFLVVLGLGVVAVMGGALLLIIPAIYVSVMITFSVFAFMLDQKKGKEALATSWAYVKGNWWKVFGRYLVLGIAFGIAQSIINAVLGKIFPPSSVVLNLPEGSSVYLPQWFGSSGAWMSSLSVTSPAALLLSTVINTALFGPLTLVYSFLIYKGLKSARLSGISEPELAAARKSVKTFSVLGIVAFALIVLIIIGSFGFALFSLKSIL